MLPFFHIASTFFCGDTWKSTFLKLKKLQIFQKLFWLFGVSFLKNRQKSLLPALKSFLRVVWPSKLYQKFPWTLINIFRMYNVSVKSIEHNLRPKNPKSTPKSQNLILAVQKSFFQTWMRIDFWAVECVLWIL